MTYPLTAILSDLHGNAPALETALADARTRGARRYVCLGDVIGYGAQPRHNLDQVMRLCVPEPEGGAEYGPLEPGLCLQGNHEFALLNMGLANAYIVNWEAKYHYNFWRPVTAIRNGDRDGNDATERDAGWSPLAPTPMHPEYPSQASISAGGRGIA